MYFQVMIFFSAHGVPVSYVENAGDPYRDQMEECIFLIMKELKAREINNDHTLAYQVSPKAQVLQITFCVTCILQILQYHIHSALPNGAL